MHHHRKLTRAELEIVDAWSEPLSSGIKHTNLGASGQATVIRVAGVLAYVCESQAVSSSSQFATSSAHRMRTKLEGHDGAPQVLRLAAPDERWDQIAELVAELDALGRPVVRSGAWTMNGARTIWEGVQERRDSATPQTRLAYSDDRIDALRELLETSDEPQLTLV